VPKASRPAPFALAVFAAVAAAGFALRSRGALADDWLLGGLYREPRGGRDLDWALVLADHWTPWLFSDWGYFRPVTTLAMAGWLALVGRDAADWNLLNVLLHALNAALFAGLLPALGVRAWPALIAVASAAAHPATVEAVLWFSSVNELVAVAGTLLACHGLLRTRRQQPLGRPLWMLGLWIALGGKENGLAAVLVLALLDMLPDGEATPAARLRRHFANTGPVLLAHLGLRAVAGCFDPGAGGAAAFAGGFVQKVGLCTVPPLAHHATAGAAVFLGVVGLAMLLAQRCDRALLLALALLATYCAFGLFHHVNPSYEGARLLYPAVFAAAVAIGRTAACALRRRAGIALVAALGLSVVASAFRTHARCGEMAAAAAAGQQIATSVRTIERDAPDGQIVCPMLFPQTLHDTLAFLPNLLFPLVERDSIRPNRLLPLAYLSSFVLPSRAEHERGLPLRVACELDALLLNVAADGIATPLPAALLRQGVPPGDQLRPDAQGSVRFPGPASPLQIEALEFESREPKAATARAARVRWQFADGNAAAAPTRFVAAPGARRLEVADDFALFAGFLAGGVTGCQLELEGPDGALLPIPADLAVRVAGAPVRLPALAPLAGRRFSRAAFEQALTAPDSTPAAGQRLRLGLLLPSSGMSCDVTPGQPVRLPEPVARYVDWTLRIAPEITIVFWFYEQGIDANAPRLGRRSAPDRCVLCRSSSP
jgi:hypothetical protein